MSGRHEGERGLVTKVADKIVYVFSDISRIEVRVDANDVKLSSEAGEGDALALVTPLHPYNVFDLVRYNNGYHVGVVLAVEREAVKVINEHGEVQMVRAADVEMRVVPKRGTGALDS